MIMLHSTFLETITQNQKLVILSKYNLSDIIDVDSI